MTGLQVNQLFRLTAAKIFCSPPGCMLVESSEDIDSDAGIERVVGTEDDIDGPAHGGIIKYHFSGMLAAKLAYVRLSAGIHE